MSSQSKLEQRPFAVVTGASMGIGFELAKQFSLNGYDLIIASSNEMIFEAQESLEIYGNYVEAYALDLGTYNGVEILIKAIKSFGKPLEVMTINPGVEFSGDFLSTNLRKEIKLMNLNIISVVHLTKRVLPFFKAQGFGRVLYISSKAPELPAPFETVYEASKAFVSSFADSMRNETIKYGVTVTHLTDDLESEPSHLAHVGFEALMKGEEKIGSDSFKNKFQVWFSRILPEGVKSKH